MERVWRCPKCGSSYVNIHAEIFTERFSCEECRHEWK